jgi:hypothetical protein
MPTARLIVVVGRILGQALVSGRTSELKIPPLRQVNINGIDFVDAQIAQMILDRENFPSLWLMKAWTFPSTRRKKTMLACKEQITTRGNSVIFYGNVIEVLKLNHVALSRPSFLEYQNYIHSPLQSF